VFKTRLSILFLFLIFLGFGQKENDSIVIPEDQTSILENRSFNDSLSKKYSGEEFDYLTNDGPTQNLITRFLRWFFNKIENTFGFKINPDTLKVFEYLIYILMGILAIYLLVKFLVGENLSTLFTKKATSLIDINLAEDHIENVDLDALVKKALEQKDYRLAVRYQFLRILKSLSLVGAIEWHHEKTNSDYYAEIEKPDTKARFKELSYIYDYIWYGEQEIDSTKYNGIERLFDVLNNSLKL